MTTQAVRAFFANMVKEGTFHRVIDKLKLIEAGNGKILAELKVEKEHTNHLQTMHGGLSATIIDIITSGALSTHKNCLGMPAVSVDLHLTYLKSAKEGDEIIVACETIKAGKTLGHMKCEIRNKATGEMLVKGLQTLYIVRPTT